MNDNVTINNLEEDLQEFLSDAEKILGYETEGINNTVNDLLSLNTNVSVELARDILDVENDITLTEEFLTEEDDPFNSLFDEDNEF